MMRPVLRDLSRSCVVVVASLICPALSGQEAATITGTVTDPAGAAVPGAKITITNTATGQVRATVTTDSGNYSAPQLRIGPYMLKAEAGGFKTYERRGIVLNVSDVVRVDIPLQIGEVRDSVTVEANAVQVQSDTNEVSQTITDTQVSQLTTNGRNVLQLTALVPGAASNMPDFDSPVAQFQNRQVSFNGQRSDHNNWLIDGGEAYDRGGGGILIVSPSQDALQEFKVMTSNYAADLGLSSGGMISMALKSGTRNFHGQLWEYVRNDALNTNNFIANRAGTAKPIMRYNTWGFNAGGPVTIPGIYNKDRNRTFFFYNMEWRRLTQGGQILANAPPAAQFNGDFSGANPIRVPNTSDPAAIARFAQFGLSPGQPFPNNQIPRGLIDPNARALLDAGIFPAANTTGNRFSAAAPTRTRYREEIVRMDHQITDKLNLMGHLIWDSGNQNQPLALWSSDTYPTVGSQMRVPSYQATSRLTHTISPALLNEVSFNYTGNQITNSPTGIYEKPSGYNVPEFFAENRLNRIPQINIGAPYGVAYDASSWPWYNRYDSYTFREDFSWIRGKHSLKFGGTFQRTRKDQDIFGRTQGNFTFDGSNSGNGFSDFLLGFASGYSELQLQDAVNIAANTFSFYGMDNWRVNNRLTVNLGLRWEGVPHAYDLNDRLSNFYPELYDPAKRPIFKADGSLDPAGPGFATVPGIALSNVAFYVNGIGLAGRNGIPSGLVQNSWGSFAPRVGFAFDLTGDQKTILRAGFGMFYERIAGNDVYNMGPDPPFSFTPNPSNVYFSNPSINSTTGLQATTPIFPSSFIGLAGNDYKLPTSVQYNFGIQRQLSSAAVLSVSYVGNGNYHQSAVRQFNPVSPSSPNRLAVCGGNCGYTGARYDPNRDRIFPGLASITVTEAAGTSSYHSLQVGLRMNATHGLTLSGAYTYSHAIDIAPGGGDLNTLSNPFDRNYDRGSSFNDRRHIAIFTYVYELPFFRDPGRHSFVSSMLGGWVLSGITTMETGLPLTATLGLDNLGLGGNTTNRPHTVAPVTYTDSAEAWFSKSSFAAPGPLRWGNTGRGTIRGPGRHNWNMALFKGFRMPWPRNPEGARFEFRAETFNTFNHTQFNGVGTTFTSGNFGTITSVFDPRVIQLGAKFRF